MELRGPDSTFKKSGPYFDSAHADTTSPVVVSFKTKAEIRQVTAASARQDDENISEARKSLPTTMLFNLLEHSSEDEHLCARSNYEGDKRSPQAQQRQAMEGRYISLILGSGKLTIHIDFVGAKAEVELHPGRSFDGNMSR